MRAAKTRGRPSRHRAKHCLCYAPGEGARGENNSLDVAAEGTRQLTVQGIQALEHEALETSGIEGVVLRYGYLYGPGT